MSQARRVEHVEGALNTCVAAVDRVVRRRRAAVPALLREILDEPWCRAEHRVAAHWSALRGDGHLHVAQREVGTLDPRVETREERAEVVAVSRARTS